MPFFEIEFPLAGLEADAAEAALAHAGACSVTFEDMRDDPVLEPLPGEMRLWRETLVRAMFDDAHDPARCLNLIGTSLGAEIAAAARVRAVPERVWERVWLQDWKPLRFGPRLWVCPTDAQAPADPDAVVVRLDPGLAFGTGTHATTALCLEALASLDLARPVGHRLRLRLGHTRDRRAEARRGRGALCRSGSAGADREPPERAAKRRRRAARDRRQRGRPSVPPIAWSRTSWRARSSRSAPR